MIRGPALAPLMVMLADAVGCVGGLNGRRSTGLYGPKSPDCAPRHGGASGGDPCEMRIHVEAIVGPYTVTKANFGQMLIDIAQLSPYCTKGAQKYGSRHVSPKFPEMNWRFVSDRDL